MNVFTLAPEAVREEINEPKNYVSNDGFEEFVRKTLFPESHYILVNKTHDNTDDVDEFIKSLKEPYFKFRARRYGKEFYVEMKYRSIFYKGAIDWCQPFQLKIYQTFDISIPIYVVIGIGGQPTAPYQISLIPMEQLSLIRLYPSFLKKYRVPACRCVTEEQLFTISS